MRKKARTKRLFGSNDALRSPRLLKLSILVKDATIYWRR